MVIYPLKIKVLIMNFIKSQLSIFCVLYLYPYYINPPVNLQVYFSIVVGIVYTFAYSDYSIYKVNVNINEKDKNIGALKAIFFNRKKVIYINRNNVDIDKSSKRTLFEKLIGRYTIYEIDGLGFRIYKNLYSRPDFERLRVYVKNVLGIEIQ